MPIRTALVAQHTHRQQKAQFFLLGFPPPPSSVLVHRLPQLPAGQRRHSSGRDGLCSCEHAGGTATSAASRSSSRCLCPYHGSGVPRSARVHPPRPMRSGGREPYQQRLVSSSCPPATRYLRPGTSAWRNCAWMMRRCCAAKLAWFGDDEIQDRLEDTDSTGAAAASFDSHAAT